jgi:hypothetical protein
MLSEWRPVNDIIGPCADISFSYLSNASRIFQVRMHFSFVEGAPKRDLLIVFKGCIGLRWSDECLTEYPFAEPAPIIGKGKWAQWTYPLLLMSPSQWLKKHEGLPLVEDRLHYILVSMNDDVEVLALENPEVKWVVANEV